MTVTSFQIVNEGPIEKARCNNVPTLMIIVGPNGVGKSTLLENLNENRWSDTEVDDSNFIITENSHSHRFAYYGPHRSPQTRSIGLNDLVNIDEHDFATLMSSSQARNLPGVPNNTRSRLTGDRVPYTAVKKRMADFKRKKRDLLEKAYDDENRDLIASVPDLVSPLQDAIDGVLPKLSFTDIHKNENDEYILQFEDQNGEIVSFDELSSGEKDLISMVFLAVEDEITKIYAEAGMNPPDRQNLVVLVDGPEAHLHPDLQRRLVHFLSNYIRRTAEEDRTVQFIMATHSKAILDSVPRESIYFLKSPNNASNQLQHIDNLGPESTGEIMGEMGLLALSSGRHLLLVEGPTDRDIISLMFPKIEEVFTILPMEGRDRVKEIETFNRLVKELVASGREIYAILDGDRENEVDSSIEDRVHVLPYTCIENVLLQPEPIYEALRAWVDPSHGSVSGIDSPEDINNMISDIVSNPSFIQNEVWTRFNEEFNPINVSRKEFHHHHEYSDFEDFTIEKVKQRISETREVSDIETEVQKLADDNEWDKLDGKRITDELSSEFNLNVNRFSRIVAEKIEEMDAQPATTTGFLNDIHERVR